MSNARLHPLFRAAFDDLRDGNAALARAAAKGPLKQDGTRMAYLRTRDDEDPEYRTSEEKMAAEIADQASVIADLQEALDEAINYLAVWAVVNSDEKASALLDKCTAALANSRGTP